MKKILALILALVMCVSLCACGNRNIASPGAANEGTDNESVSNEADDAENSEAVLNGDDAISNNNNEDASGDSNVSNDTDNVGGDGGSNIINSGSDASGVILEAPESTDEYKYTSDGASIDISYGDGMRATETSDGSAVVEYGDCRLYVQNVTSEFDPSKDEPATFLYDYAYNKCVDLVVNTYGEITQFTGEYNLDVSGNEIYGYGANMTCNPQIQVYTFIKLVTLDNGEGYAVLIGICDQNNAGVFDNVKVQ